MFSVLDYQAASSVPVSVRLIVKDGVLTAQYTKLPAVQGYASAGWRKLYLYEAASRTVRQLEFGFPAGMEAIEGTREDTVAATANLQLDTRLQSPDGYELSYGDGSRRWAARRDFLQPAVVARAAAAQGRHQRVTRHRRAVAVRRTASAEFVGWVTGTR